MTARLQKTPDALPAARQSPALEGYFQIMEHWGADNAVSRCILGNPPERTFFEWKKGKVGRVPNGNMIQPFPPLGVMLLRPERLGSPASRQEPPLKWCQLLPSVRVRLVVFS